MAGGRALGAGPLDENAALKGLGFSVVTEQRGDYDSHDVYPGYRTATRARAGVPYAHA